MLESKCVKKRFNLNPDCRHPDSDLNYRIYSTACIHAGQDINSSALLSKIVEVFDSLGLFEIGHCKILVEFFLKH